ncbi:MAG: hypothetical protein DMG97_19480 [Acidobacteria bacterium]|nr:MAG: hypothetical protein DMG97_19480 [Acidobacteriota bacterium]
MKRDMELLRTLMLEIEKLPHVGQRYFEIPGYSIQQVYYHALLAKDAGFIDATFPSNDKWGWGFRLKRLTYEGHEFLDAARDDTLWNKAKDAVQGSTGVLTLEALKIALGMLMQAGIKMHVA